MTGRVGRSAAVAVLGMTGKTVAIEASFNSGLPGIDIVGLPDAAVSESKKRVRAAISNMGVTLSQQRITVSLSPGNLRKEGTVFDLGIALAILAAETLVPGGCEDIVCYGELGLDNRLHPVTGVLPAVMAAQAAGFERMIVPRANLDEASMVTGMRVLGAVDLAQVVNSLGGRVRETGLPAVEMDIPQVALPRTTHDLAEVQGQAQGRFALEVAAAGGHHMYMTGSPGAGKTLLAECLPSIVPPLTPEAAMEVLALRSTDGAIEPGNHLCVVAPFEAPHHSATRAAFIGTSKYGRLGVIGRAHRGILFMDEVPEFSRDVLESLREPLEHGYCNIERSWGSVRMPSDFQLIMASNPCPCGASGAPGNRCICTPAQRKRYRSKLSEPLLDRIDIQLNMLPVAPADLVSGRPQETSATVAARVERARAAQTERYAGLPWELNAKADGAFLLDHFALTRKETAPLHDAMERRLLSARGFTRILRVATSLADLDGIDRPGREHVLQAFALRMKDVR
jgi:magnesium chelatase family protein